MRFPAYGRELMDRRAAGTEFWLAIVAVGWMRDGETLRGVSGVARVGCPEDQHPARLDWRCLTGLDVLVTMFAGPNGAVLGAALDAIWAARPATLWMHSPLGYATLLEPDPVQMPRAARKPWIRSYLPPAAIGPGLRETVARARQLALLTASGPLFSDPLFDPPREALLQRWAA